VSCLAPLLALALVQPGGPAIPVTAPAPAPPEGPASAPQPAPAVDHELPVRSERAAPAAEQRQLTWSRERRRLQLHTGLSGGFTGAMLLTGTLLLVLTTREAKLGLIFLDVGRAVEQIKKIL